MAEDDATEDENGEGAAKPPSGSKKKLILLIVMALAIAGISVGGTLAAIKIFSPPSANVEAEGEDAEPIPARPSPAIYYPLKPALVVNFDVKGKAALPPGRTHPYDSGKRCDISYRVAYA